MWRMTLRNNRSPLLCYLSFVHHFVAIGEFKLELQSRNAQFGSNSTIIRAVRPWNLTDDLEKQKGTLLPYFKLCASFRSHWWIKTGVTVRKHPIWVKFDDFFEPCDHEIWRMTLKNNRAPLLSNIKLYALSHYYMWIQTGVTVRKRLSWVVTSVTLTFHLWPWPFAQTLPWSFVITPENFMMIRWWEHSENGVTDGRTDGQKIPFIKLLGRS